MVHMYRKCLGGSYKEGTNRSQRDLFGVFIDWPAGMPDIMVGQTRSVSLPRKIDKTRSAVTEAHQTAEAQSTEHLTRFVTETSVAQSPWAMEDEKILAEAQGDDPTVISEVESGAPLKKRTAKTKGRYP